MVFISLWRIICSTQSTWNSQERFTRKPPTRCVNIHKLSQMASCEVSSSSQPESDVSVISLAGLRKNCRHQVEQIISTSKYLFFSNIANDCIILFPLETYLYCLKFITTVDLNNSHFWIIKVSWYSKKAKKSTDDLSFWCSVLTLKAAIQTKFAA